MTSETPFIELRNPDASGKPQRIDVALLLETLTQFLLDAILGLDDPLRSSQQNEIAVAMRILMMVIQLGKTDMLELEDFVDGVSDVVVDICLLSIVLIILRA